MGIKAGRESDIQTAIQDLIELAGLPRPLRINSGGLPVRGRNGKNYWVKGAPAGTADLIGVVSWSAPGMPGVDPRPVGRLLAIECKRPGGRVRPGQREFLEAVRAAGGIGLLADSLDVINRALAELRRDPAARLDESGYREGSGEGD